MQEDKVQQKGQSIQDEFMRISDHSQERESNPSNSQVEIYPLEDDNDVDQYERLSSKEQKLYVQKIQQLQKKCNNFSISCSFLTRRIEDLQHQIQEQENAALNLEEVFNIVMWLEDQIEQYKDQLGKYRQKQVQNSNQRNKEIEHLIKTVELVKGQRDLLLREREEMDQKNNELEVGNSNLLNQIDSLQSEISELRQTKKGPRVTKSYQPTFNDEIQLELQTLIDKLMSQLEVQRNCNRKSVLQMRRMQDAILELERQIVSKNNKIYSLEMSNIIAKKESPKNQSKVHTIPSNRSFLSIKKTVSRNEGEPKSKSDRSNILKNLFLEQVLSGSIEVSERERYTIASKLVYFYMKKYENSQFQPLNTDQLIVCNYNKTNPSLITIKKDQNAYPYEGDSNPLVLSWNLGILLSKILIEPTYESQFTDKSIQIVDRSIDRFIHEENPTAKSVRELKGLIDEVLRSID